MTDDFDNPAGENPSSLPGGFRAAVTAALGESGYKVRSWEGDGVNVTAPGGDEQYIGLSNLYRRARRLSRAEWPDLIREFLSHLAHMTSGPGLPADLLTIRGRLRPRLGRPFSRNGRTQPWGVPLPGTGLEVNLVVDYPHTMAYVTEEMLLRTGRPGEDLLDIALANLRSATPADYLEPVSPDLDIYVGHCGDGYDAARALLVEELLPESPAGYWVAIPSREELAVWPVSFSALEKIHVIRLFAEENYREHPYPITDEVFWVRHGTWVPFGIRVGSEGVTVNPPEEFLVALRDLPHPGGDDPSPDSPC